MLGRLSMVAVTGLLLTACGTNVEQRSATGALGGAGIGALAGGPVGAAIGFGAGAVAGAAAPAGADQVAMWGLDRTDRFVASNRTMHEMASEGTSRLPARGSAGSSAGGTGTQMVTVAAPADADFAATPQAVRDAQRSLRAQGLYNGPADGIFGPKTKTALSQYQQRNNLRQTARLDPDTLNRLRSDSTNAAAASRNQPETAGQSGNPNAMPTDQGAASDQSQSPTADQTPR